MILGLVASSCARGPSARVDVPIWSVTHGEGATFRIEVPSRFGSRIGNAGSYELAASVAIPPGMRSGPCRLWIPSFLANPTVFVDGQRAERQGLLLPTDFAVRQPHAYVVPAEAARDGVVDLRMVVPHRWPFDTALETTPRILPASEFDAESAAILVVNVLFALFALGAALVASIGVAFVAIASPGHRHYGLVALAMLGLVPYVLVGLGLGQASLGPGEVFVAATGLGVTVLSTLWSVAAFLDRPAPSRWWFAAFATIPATRAFWPATADSLHAASLFAGALFLAGLSHQVRMLLALSREGVAGARLWLACWLTLAIASTPDVVLWSGGPDLARGFRTSMVGLFVFGCFFAYLTTEGEALRLLRVRAELDKRVDDLVGARDAAASITRSLEAGVIARSTRYYTALAGLANHKRRAVLPVGYRVDDDLVIVAVLDAETGRYQARRSDTGEFVDVVVFSNVRGPRLAAAASLLARLSELVDPGITRPLDVDVTRDGYLFAVFARAADRAFDRAFFARLPPAERLRMTSGLARALAVLHQAGIVHGAIDLRRLELPRDPKSAPHLALGCVDLGTKRLTFEARAAIARRAAMEAANDRAVGDAIASELTVIGPASSARARDATVVDPTDPNTLADIPRTHAGDALDADAGSTDFSTASDVTHLVALARALIAPSDRGTDLDEADRRLVELLDRVAGDPLLRIDASTLADLLEGRSVDLTALASSGATPRSATG